jgi:hypothetical protein
VPRRHCLYLALLLRRLAIAYCFLVVYTFFLIGSGAAFDALNVIAQGWPNKAGHWTRPKALANWVLSNLPPCR